MIIDIGTLSGHQQLRFLAVLAFKIYLRFRSTWTTVRNDRHLSLSLSVIIHVIEIGSVIHANMHSKKHFIHVLKAVLVKIFVEFLIIRVLI